MRSPWSPAAVMLVALMALGSVVMWLGVPLDEDGAVKLMRLIDALEDQDDVDAVHANFDVDADVLERVAG